MMPGSFSGTLLESDLLGTSAAGAGAPPFLGSAEAAGAACDPAIFLVDPEPADSQQAAYNHFDSTAAAMDADFTAGRSGSLPLAVPPRPQPASAADVLRELESCDNFFLPGQPLDTLLLGGAATTGSTFVPPLSLSPSTPPSTWHPAPASFPAIPEEAELPHAQLPPSLLGLSGPLVSSALGHAAPQAPVSVFVPVAVPAPAPDPLPSLVLPSSSVAAEEAATSSSGSEAASPTASSTSSQAHAGARSAYPRISSMPNLHLNLVDSSVSAAPAPAPRRKGGASGRSSRAMLRSRSHADLRAGSSGGGAGAAGDAASELQRYNVPHLPFLTPPHLRKGKGGRQPASDPRLDPSIDPKRARRIMANRLSAAKSKMKQKNAAQVEALKVEMERMQREGQIPEVPELEAVEALAAPPSLAQH